MTDIEKAERLREIAAKARDEARRWLSNSALHLVAELAEILTVSALRGLDGEEEWRVVACGTEGWRVMAGDRIIGISLTEDEANRFVRLPRLERAARGLGDEAEAYVDCRDDTQIFHRLACMRRAIAALRSALGKGKP